MWELWLLNEFVCCVDECRCRLEVGVRVWVDLCGGCVSEYG